MLVGMKCKVGNMIQRNLEGFKFYEGVIASEPLMTPEHDFLVVVLVDGKLIRVDTDYIFDLGV